ncbi:hypothetical protein RUM43_002449 [Polyplax serrata]|uniref:Epoxide hydrolase n=1 Tax=Polyplax serrata TaxID=468196 RepID=A0AAN8NTE7_POLSC
MPKPNENVWWGPGSSKDINRNIVPFKINIPDSEIAYLKERLGKYLERSHVPPLENQGFQYGFNSNYLKQVVTYWKQNYDWKKREAYLNQFPQFKTKVAGLDIHFLRVAPKNPSGKKVLPLLLLHGWPGSVREFYDLIPLLTSPRKDVDFVFEVVAPSLPGYGFSQAAVKPGFGPHEMAVVMKLLMLRLNFEKFYVSGGDWGSLIGKIMGQYYPERVLGLHSSMCMVNTPLSNLKWILGSIYPPLVVESRFQKKLYPVSNIFSGILKEMGYMMIQATKPDTVGSALSDTPAGLAAYILEKFSTWTNKEWQGRLDGGLTEKYSLDALLDNVMIYWFTNSITTSQRLYSEAFSTTEFELQRFPIPVPTACARFHNDLLWQPESFLREQFINLIHVSDFEDIGHFSAFEAPKEYNHDVWTAVQKIENYHREAATKKTAQS